MITRITFLAMQKDDPVPHVEEPIVAIPTTRTMVVRCAAVVHLEAPIKGMTAAIFFSAPFFNEDQWRTAFRPPRDEWDKVEQCERYVVNVTASLMHCLPMLSPVCWHVAVFEPHETEPRIWLVREWLGPIGHVYRADIGGRPELHQLYARMMLRSLYKQAAARPYPAETLEFCLRADPPPPFAPDSTFYRLPEPTTCAHEMVLMSPAGTGAMVPVFSSLHALEEWMKKPRQATLPYVEHSKEEREERERDAPDEWEHLAMRYPTACLTLNPEVTFRMTQPPCSLVPAVAYWIEAMTMIYRTQHALKKQRKAAKKLKKTTVEEADDDDEEEEDDTRLCYIGQELLVRLPLMGRAWSHQLDCLLRGAMQVSYTVARVFAMHMFRIASSMTRFNRGRGVGVISMRISSISPSRTDSLLSNVSSSQLTVALEARGLYWPASRHDARDRDGAPLLVQVAMTPRQLLHRPLLTDVYRTTVDEARAPFFPFHMILFLIVCMGIHSHIQACFLLMCMIDRSGALHSPRSRRMCPLMIGSRAGIVLFSH